LQEKDDLTKDQDSLDLSVNFDITRFEQAYLHFLDETPSDKRNTVVEQWIANTIKDLRYIESMKEMEQVLMPAAPLRTSKQR